MEALVLILIVGFFYFLPSIIAISRHKSNAGAIVVMNLFLGWSFLGWVLSLVWACTAEQPKAMVVNQVYMPQQYGQGYPQQMGYNQPQQLGYNQPQQYDQPQQYGYNQNQQLGQGYNMPNPQQYNQGYTNPQGFPAVQPDQPNNSSYNPNR